MSPAICVGHIHKATRTNPHSLLLQNCLFAEAKIAGEEKRVYEPTLFTLLLDEISVASYKQNENKDRLRET